MTTNLVQRCREILEWDKTGQLRNGAVRELVSTMPPADEFINLSLAEDRTAREAMEFVIAMSAILSSQIESVR